MAGIKLIIAGSRSITSYKVLNSAITAAMEEWVNPNITEVVSGTARGVDKLGEIWANRNGIRIRRFPAKWNTYGLAAGFKRNEEMANYADACLVVYDGKSRGSAHMIGIAKDKGLRLFVYQTPSIGDGE